MALIPLVVIVGPTASGKTKLAVDTALLYGGEVVSADSMQIYKGMNIGTAKPSRAEMRGVRHHMIDVVGPDENFSVADYVKMAREAIEDINSRGKLAIVAGGTGLYVDSLVTNTRFSQDAASDPALRAEKRRKAELEGGQSLLDELAAYDPDSAARLHPRDVGRIIRAIEVYELTGVTMTETLRRSRLAPGLYDCRRIGLRFADRQALYDRINRRVDEMFSAGLEAEARGLLEEYGEKTLTSMQAIGYKELAKYFDGGITLAEAEETIKQGTRRYAKRQMTWFGRDEATCWIEAGDEYSNICKHAFSFIDNSGLLCYNR
jgi:tRNA dimethylallyltransferase